MSYPHRTALALTSVAAAFLTFALAAAPAFAERTYESNIEGFSSSFGVAVDGQDNVWISDTATGLISRYDAFPSQTKLGEQGGEGQYGTSIRSIALDNSTERLYVADSGPVVVDLFENGTGPFSEKWSTENSCGLIYVAVDNSGGASQGRVYMARSCSGPQHIQAFKSNHEPADFSSSAGYLSENHITGTPFGEIGEIANIATDSSGDLYVVDRTNSVVDEFAPSGAFVQEFKGTGVPGGFSNELAGVAVDPTNDNVFVVDQGNHVVDEFESSGAYLGQLTGTGPSESTPFSALNGGIAVNSSGYVYVADGSAVDIFSPNAILPKVNYEPASNQTQTSGTLNASISLNGGPEVTSCTFQYGTSTAYGSSVPCSPATPYSSTTAVSANISGLTTEATYHYRVVLTTANGTKKANDQTYIPHAVAGLTTQTATDVERNTATLNGSFNGDGEDTHYYFEWGATESYGNKTPVEDAGAASGPHAESFDLSGLTVETTYHYRIVASNAVGTSFGSDQTFKTLAAVEKLNTEPASAITASTATLNAAYEGIGEDVHYYFEWGTDTTYGHLTAAPPGIDAGAQTGNQSVSFELAGLQVDQTYHYRVLAVDAAGTTVGLDQGFTTLGRYQFSTDFGSAGSGDGELSHPQDVAIDNSSGDIYVADVGNHRIVKYDSSGQFLAAWGWGVANGNAESQVCTSGCQIGLSGTAAGQFEQPTFVEVDNSSGPSAGDVYVADTGDNLVQKFDPAGNLIGAWGSGGAINFSKSGTIGGITVDPSGNLYVLTDNTPFNWTIVSQDGVSRTKYPTNGTWEDGDRLELGPPKGTGIDISGSDVWYENTENGVRYSTPTASEYSAFSIGPAGSGLVLDRPTNDLYVDAGSFIQQFPARECDAVKQCAPSDTFGAGDLSNAAGLAFQPMTHAIYAANSGADDIAVFTPLPAPEVETAAATNPGPTSGTITGHVDPGSGQVSSCYFEYLEGAITNEIQILEPKNVTGGTYTLNFEGDTTAPIVFEESTFSYSAIQSALEQLPNIGAENVRVYPLEKGVYKIEFIGRFTQVNVPQLEVNAAAVLPANATLSVNTESQGQGWGIASTVPCTQATPISAPTEVSADLSGLKPLTAVHYRLVAIRSDGKGFPVVGHEKTFTTGSILRPVIDSTAVSSVSPTTALFKADVNPNFSSTIYRFEYGTSTSYGSQTLPSESIGEDGTSHEVIAEVTDLLPGKTYHFRAIAINLNGPAEGEDQTFNTPDHPSVTVGTASSVTSNAATVSAQIQPGFLPTTYHFEYGRTTAYGSSTAESASIGSDNGVHIANGVISGLLPATTYHFRIAASNAIGSTGGPDTTFTTAPASAPVPGGKRKSLRCKKGFAKRHGKCVKPHHQDRHKRKSSHG